MPAEIVAFQTGAITVFRSIPLLRWALRWLLERGLEVTIMPLAEGGQGVLAVGSGPNGGSAIAATLRLRFANHKGSESEHVTDCLLAIKRPVWGLWRRTVSETQVVRASNGERIDLVLTRESGPQEVDAVARLTPDDTPLPDDARVHLVVEVMGSIRRLERELVRTQYRSGFRPALPALQLAQKQREEYDSRLSQIQSALDAAETQAKELTQRIEADAWLTSLAPEDREHLSAKVHVYSTGVNLEHLNDPGPSVDFIFDVVNASVFTVILHDTAAGHVHSAATGPLKGVPEVDISGARDADGVWRIPHAGKRQIRLHQWLEKAEAEAILAAYTPHALVSFNLTNVIIRVRPENDPPGDAATMHELCLKSVESRMPDFGRRSVTPPAAPRDAPGGTS